MSRLTILVADDDLRIQDLYRKGLNPFVFDLHLCKNGAEAKKMFIELSPDLLILDIMMPELSGITVLGQIREQLNNKIVPIIMATAKKTEDDVQQCLRLGIQGYIVKPFNVTEMVQKVLKVYKSYSKEKGNALIQRYYRYNQVKSSKVLYQEICKILTLNFKDEIPKMNCIYCSDKNRSLNLISLNNSFNCRSCSKGGDLVSLVCDLKKDLSKSEMLEYAESLILNAE